MDVVCVLIHSIVRLYCSEGFKRITIKGALNRETLNGLAAKFTRVSQLERHARRRFKCGLPAGKV